jgi:hypothetical protein
MWWPGTELNRRRQPFQKINSDYNDFVARVALEVVDSAWWKQQLRVKSAGSRKLPSLIGERARSSRYSAVRISVPIWFPVQSLQC